MTVCLTSEPCTIKRDEGSCIKQDYSPSRTEYMIQSFLFRVKLVELNTSFCVCGSVPVQAPAGEGEVGSGWRT